MWIPRWPRRTSSMHHADMATICILCVRRQQQMNAERQLLHRQEHAAPRQDTPDTKAEAPRQK